MDMDNKKNHENMVNEYTLSELKRSIDCIHEVVAWMRNPESIDQAKDNLKGIGRYVETVLAKYEISTKWES